MVTHYFVMVEDGNKDNRVEYFNILTGAVEFADLGLLGDVDRERD